MYKIDFEIKVRAEHEHPSLAYRQDYTYVLFHSNQYLLKKGVEFGLNRCLEITKIGFCKTTDDAFISIRGRYFCIKIDNFKEIEEKVDFCIRREFKNDDLIIETKFTNVVEFNNIYYYLFVHLKEKMQSAFNSLKQRFLGKNC